VTGDFVTKREVKGKILIVDDEAHVGELLCRFLAPEGFECAAVTSGEKAIAVLESGDFDLVISDIMMPGMSGIDLLNIVRRLRPNTAMLMVTAVDDRDTGVMAVELGAYGYVIKPFTKNQILIEVANVFHRRAEKLKDTTRGTSPAEVEKAPVAIIRKASVPADEILEAVRSGMEDAELMEKFDLSATDLYALLDRLVCDGKLSQSEVDERFFLSAGTVAVDVTQTRLPDSDKKKPVIRAKDAVRCIKAGTDDLALMKKFEISAKGLRSLFEKLLDAGLITPQDCYESSQLARDLILGDQVREFPKRYLAISTTIYEPEHPEVKGALQDITDKGVGIVGIRARVGEVKTFVIPTGKLMKGEDIWFEAVCLWSQKHGAEGRPAAGFQIRKISEESLQTLRELVRVLSL
jgi:DNA-binding response OmpR family regulator